MMPKNTWNVFSPETISKATDPSRTQRAARACDPCRRRRVKCEGLRPTCQQCQSSGDLCVYSDVKRVREKKQLESATSKVERYEALLQDIVADVDKDVGEKIINAMRGLQEPEGEPSLAHSSSPSLPESPREIDTAHEDINSSEALRATGFMGRNSEVSWMRSLEIEAAKTQGDEASIPHEASFASMNYHLDHLQPTVSDQVDAYGLPSRQTADELFRTYLTSVDESYPIIRRSFFVLQYQRFFSGLSPKPGDKWLAILNMVFAIGAKRSEFTRPNIPNTIDHRVYFSRASALSAGERSLYDHADLQQVQLETLTALYFLTVAQVNRGWKMIGMAARSAISLGINMRPAGEEVPWIREESRTRLWWSIHNLESLLSVMTGRASCLGTTTCTRYPPLPFEEKQYRESVVLKLFDQPQLIESNLCWTSEQPSAEAQSSREWLRSLEPTPSLYFYYLVDLARITRGIIEDVYNPKILHEKWSTTKTQIQLYNVKLDTWAARLTDSFRFMDEDGNSHLLESPYQVGLALGYYSNRILINRPGLSLRRKSQETIDTEDPIPRSRVDDDTAFICLSAALALIGTLPAEPDCNWIYEKSPWWCIIHLLMQATVVLHLWLSAVPATLNTEPGQSVKREDASQVIDSYEEVLSGCEKVLLWLKCLSVTNDSASRAYELCYRLFRRIVSGKEPTQPELFSSSTFLVPRAIHSSKRYSRENQNALNDPEVERRISSLEEQTQFQTVNDILSHLFDPHFVSDADVQMDKPFFL